MMTDKPEAEPDEIAPATDRLSEWDVAKHGPLLGFEDTIAGREMAMLNWMREICRQLAYSNDVTDIRDKWIMNQGVKR